WRMFAFAAGSAVLCLAFIGLAPAIKLSRVDISELLKTGSGTGTSRKSRRQYGALVVAQIALALTLLVSATLLLRTAAGLYRLQISKTFDRIVQAYVGVGPRWQGDRRTTSEASADLIARARGVKGVADAATFMSIPPKKHFISLDDPSGSPTEIGVGMFKYYVVSSAYFRTFGQKVLKGRDFQEGEFAAPLVIVDNVTARYFWPGTNPIGRLIKLGDVRSSAPWLRVIGVVEFMDHWGLFDRADPEERQAARLGGVYVLNGADSTPVGKGVMMPLAVLGTINPERLSVVLQHALNDQASGLRAPYVKRMAQIVRIDMLREKHNFVAGLFITFALLALGVAALGVYAIVSHTVSQR